jgi:hypothetical protein
MAAHPSLKSYDYLLLALVLMVLLAIAFLLPVTPQDYWWYMRIGKDTLASGAVPKVDTLTFTRSGTPVVYQSWGAAVLFWLLYQAGGLSLTVLARGLLLGLTFFLLWWSARGMGAGRMASVLALLLAVLASSNNWSVRPQLIAYPLFALSLFILLRWQAGGRKIVFFLPLVGLLWVNLHGSFILLILLEAAALAFGRGDRRTLALAAAGTLLATLINPDGFGAWIYVYHSLTVPSSQLFSAEWQPPVNTGWQMNLFFLTLLGFPLLAAFSPRRLTLLEWSWVLGFGFLALWGERYVIWFLFLLAVMIPLLLAGLGVKAASLQATKPPAPDHPLPNASLALLVVLVPLLLLPGVRTRWWASAPPATEDTPSAATAWLAAHPNLPGPLWSEIGFSSYLEFALPGRPTWIDTRFEVFPVAQWQAYQAISEARFDWVALLQASGAHLVMISISEQPELVKALAGSPSWCRLYQDGVAVIYSSGPCGAR